METNVAIALERKGKLQVIPLDVMSCDPPSLWTSYQTISFQSNYKEGLSKLADILEIRATPPQIAGVLKSGAISDLRAVTVLEPEGNLAAEVMDLSSELQRESSQGDRTTPELPQVMNQERPSIKTKITLKHWVAILGLIVAIFALPWIWEKLTSNPPPLPASETVKELTPTPPPPPPRETVTVYPQIGQDKDRGQYTSIKNTLAKSRFTVMPLEVLNRRISRSEIRYCNPSNTEDATALKSLLESKGFGELGLVNISDCDAKANRNILELWVQSSN